MSQTTQVSEQQRILLMEQQIGLRMEKLIPDMQDMAKSYNLKDERSPFRNVLDVATEPGSGIEVTKNFIRYQLGRSGANAMWSNPFRGENELFQGKNFAVALVEVIDRLGNDAKQIVEKMSEKLETELESSWQQQVHRRLMQLYLGYLVRYQVYLANEKGGK